MIKFANVKQIAFILALIIFSTSVRAGQAYNYMLSAINVSVSHSCCQAEKTKDACASIDQDQQDENHEKDCCSGPDCDCKCCLHVVYFQNFNMIKFAKVTFPETQYGYRFNYDLDYLTAVFHPPSLLK